MREHGSGPPRPLMNGRWLNREQAVFGFYWFQFLHLSPSYELAHKERTGTLSDADRARLPADFDAVLSVYDDFGDLHRIRFDDWWNAKGIRHFGFQGEQPSVHLIERLEREADNSVENLTANASNYINGRWADQGQPSSLIVSIPLVLTKAQILKIVSEMLSEDSVRSDKVSTSPPTYSVLAGKKDPDSLFRYLQCIWTRLYYPHAKLYEVGVIAELSTTYSLRLAKYEGGVEDRNALKILTSRALHRGIMIAENAARGKFPSYRKCEHAVAANWAEMELILRNRIEWDEASDDQHEERSSASIR